MASHYATVNSVTTIVLTWILLAIPSLAFSEGLLWNHIEQATICSSHGDGYRYCDLRLENPNFTVAYNVRAIRQDSNENIIGPVACGSHVNVGDIVRFEFAPHTPEDVYWFATGGSMDSPYGEWLPDAVGPTPIGCYTKDYLATLQNPISCATCAKSFDFYAPLAVNPPTKSILSINDFSCRAHGLASVCTATTSGNYGVIFNFSATFARLYQRLSSYSQDEVKGRPLLCAASDNSHNFPMVKLSEGARSILDQVVRASLFTSRIDPTADLIEYVLQIPEQSISCPIIVDDPTGTGPSAPTLTLNGQCTTGTSFIIDVSATDPESDPIHYAIDWNADGIADQFLPASGSVPSGSLQTASRTYATAGAKSVQVRAIDSNGMTGRLAVLAFSCSTPQSRPDTSTGGDVLTSGGDQIAEDTTAADGGVPDVFDGSAADLNLRVIPSLVRPGQTTRVHWLARDMHSCTVSAPNGDRWSTLRSIIGGEVSRPIEVRTTYTLSCLSADGSRHTKAATVSNLPNWNEH